MRPSTPFLAFALLAVFLPAYSAPVELNHSRQVKNIFSAPHWQPTVKNSLAPHTGPKLVDHLSTRQVHSPQKGKGDNIQGPATGADLSANPSTHTKSDPGDSAAALTGGGFASQGQFDLADSSAGVADGGGDDGGDG